MKLVINTRELITQGKQLEREGSLHEAAAAYQKVVDGDVDNQEAIARLLIVYRKLKEYRKELSVIEEALAAATHRDREIQQKWLQAHPKAATVGKAIFRQLGGAPASEADAAVTGLLKRKEFVERRLTGKKVKFPRPDPVRKKAIAEKQQEAKRRKEQAVAARKIALEAQRQKEDARKQKMEERNRNLEARRQAKEELKARKLAAEKAKAERLPSLFVISLRYKASLDKIDEAMTRHLAFLKKHYSQGDFLMSGRQVPRTGGIIIARSKDRASIERMMQQDPFVKRKLATADIVEFSASQVAKGLEGWLKR